MDDMDKELKGYFGRSETAHPGTRPAVGIDGVEVARFLEGQLTGERLAAVLRALQADATLRDCVRMSAGLTDQADAAGSEVVPAGWMTEMKALVKPVGGSGCRVCAQRRMKDTASALWLLLAVGSFGLSFAFSHYFIQWVVLAAFFGFKWVMDRKAARTQVMIYKALSSDAESKSGPQSRLQKPSGHL